MDELAITREAIAEKPEPAVPLGRPDQKRAAGAVMYRALRDAGPEGLTFSQLREVMDMAGFEYDWIARTVVWLRAHGVAVASVSPVPPTRFVLEAPLPPTWEARVE